MNKYGIVTKPGTIRFERLLPGPVERVWAYLIESEKKEEWLAAGDVEPRVGGKVDLHFEHRKLSQHDDPIPEKYRHMEEGTSVAGRVTQCDPPRLLSYTWGEVTGEESEVTFELKPQGEEVLLILTHRRLGDNRDTLISVASGWHTHLGILSDRLNNRQPQGFWKIHNRIEKEYEARI
jgi:uncharacterized protein YndB with AHSA1/START domain